VAMNVLQFSLDDFRLVVMARAAWRRRQCVGEKEGSDSWLVPFAVAQSNV